jgi:hypothetical protein
VWAVDEEMLAKLDVFEGCPIYYEVRPVHANASILVRASREVSW